jgi:lactoylglutathione lyase
MKATVSHVGLCVADLDRSLHFYTEGLGFEVQHRVDGDDSWASLAEIAPPVTMSAQFIAKDGMRIELLAFPVPGVHGEPSRTRNQLGLTHLALQVDDIDAVEAHLVSLGAAALEDTRTELAPGVKLVVLTDPDGNRVELVQFP